MSQRFPKKIYPYHLLILAEIKTLCGQPPVLSTESTEAYNTMRCARRVCWRFGEGLLFLRRDLHALCPMIKSVADSDWVENVGVQPCVRPVCAVHMTAGHNALRGSGPKSPHSRCTGTIGLS
jgi:hypothetical protein